MTKQRSIARHGRSSKIGAPDGIDGAAYLTAFYSFAGDDDLDAPPATLAAAALDQLRWGASRRTGRPKVRVFNPTESRDGWSSPHTIVQTITDDSPFIVDSVAMRINRASHGILKNIHPVFAVERERGVRLRSIAVPEPEAESRTESWMHIEIPRIVDRDELREIRREVEATLADVRLAVTDWRKMVAKVGDVTDQLLKTRRRSDSRAREIREFLDWLVANHFTFLGYCEYAQDGTGSEPRPQTGLGLLRESRGLQRLAMDSANHRLPRANRRHELSITKAPVRSTIHRPVPLDDVSISLPGDTREQRVEHRFVGLFTSTAYTEPPGSIPVLRSKAESIMRQSGLDPASHKGKALQHILDTLPRDELLQASVEGLTTMALDILALEGKRRIRLFVRLDSRGNFYSCLVFIPGDQFTEAVRRKIESILTTELGGTVADSHAMLTESSLARLTVTVAVEQRPDRAPDVEALTSALIEAATQWPERVRNALLKRHDEGTALALHATYSERFPLAYQATMSPERACRDIACLAEIKAGTRTLAAILERTGDDSRLRFSVLKAGEPIPLHLVHPILENMGLKVVSESNYRLQMADGDLWIKEFELEPPAPTDPTTDDLAGRFQRCFTETLERSIENDEFNSLILTAGLSWMEANLLRAYCKYLLQSRLGFSQRYMLETLARFPDLTRALVTLFHARFDPDIPDSGRKRSAGMSLKKIQAELEQVVSLDDDRILRAFVSVVEATLRTNFFRTRASTDEDCISFKLDPAGIPDLPEPRPKFEIFVYAPHVEGVHLRCGPIARGGIRWSDRREDFRTEVLGLMKAQQVKNTVIVPAGAKGGFVCKQLPAGDRAAIQVEVVRCYRTFLRGLLDITDNIVGTKTVTPDRVFRRDDPDPYLVVAADKGTATFSDIANGLSAEYGFWLGDAFASGGSAGYDHKKMGITARGAWESVKRHFRELGLDTQTENFTVVGIGDMGGDVFGNGMLLSRHIRLIAAFNHRHIFIDPDPDPASSYDERRRLFELPRSTWEDYDSGKLSTGGGVYRRDAKSIELSREARRALGTERKSLSPPELIRTLLRAPVDLLWNGGIGTYVRASTESDLDAGDPINDSVRVTGSELRCRVVGEGGNLGLTQLGRVEYARSGGKLNADFIDNSGGVDSSDREVNIKILLSDAIARGQLAPGRRNALLARMTDSVANLVLASNYAQTQSLSMMAIHSKERMGEHAQLIRLLENRGLLDRKIEFLPSDEEIEERRHRGEGLTRPELAVIMSYAKIELFESLVDTDIPDEPHCASELLGYFPGPVANRYAELIPRHRLAREIVAMLVASSITNRMRPFFALRAQEDTGAGPAQVARAYATVRSLFDTRALWLEIEALDGQVKPEVQYECFYQASRMVRRAVYWHLHRHRRRLDISRTIDALKPTITTVLNALPETLCGHAQKLYEREARNFAGLGLPGNTARRIASLRFMTQTLDIAELAVRFDTEPRTVAAAHFDLGRNLLLDWMREQIEVLEPEHRWHATARGTLRESVGREQQALLADILSRAGKDNPATVLKAWLADHSEQINRMKRTFDEMRSGGDMDFATLSIALREVSRLRG